jgi:hypothetical protein
VLALYRPCISETLKQNKNPSKPAQAETTGTENQNLLKTQILTLTEKENKSRKTS